MTPSQSVELEAVVERLDAVRRLMNDGRTELGAISDVFGTDMERRDKFSIALNLVLTALSASNARALAAEEVVKIGKQIVGDYQSSDSHHPHHVLIRLDHFDALRTTLATMGDKNDD